MIIVVTHHQPLRNELTEHLTQEGYEVSVPRHRDDVFSLVQETSPKVVVLDFYVADPNGLEIVKRLRNQGFTGKILIVAGTSIRNAVPEVLRLGADLAIGGPRGNEEPFMGGQVEAAICSLFHADIQQRAYQLFEERGCQHGRDLDDWFEAERQILKRRSHSPRCTAHVTSSSNASSQHILYS